MSIFSALTQLSSATVNAVMGERLRVVPMRPGRYKATEADADRSSHDCCGVYREFMHRIKTDGAEVGRDFNREILTPTITFSVEVADLAGRVFARPDLIVRLDQPGEPAFEISAVESDGGGRLLFTVVVA